MTVSPTRATSPTTPAATLRARLAVASREATAAEPGLVAVGVGGIVLSALCLFGVVVQGRTVPPEGKLLDAATFSFGVGVYTLTVALLLPLADFSTTARRRWRRAFYVFAVYGLALETLQAFRGLDPRFTEEGDTIDAVAGLVFGVTAASTTVLFVVLGVRFFRPGVLDDRPVLRLGIRYGAIAVGISFAVGVAMSVNAGRHVGGDGNLLFAHALGVHGLQALPLLGVLAAAGTLARPRRWVHAGGPAWLTACSAALAQAVLDRPPMELSALSVVIVAGVAGWTVATSAALVSAVRATGWRRA